MSGMGVAAVGAYFRLLADVQRMTVADATEEAGVQSKYIWRLETKDIKEPSARVLRLLTTALNGSWEDVGALVSSEEADVTEGRLRAIAWATQAGLVQEGDRRLFEQATADELQQAAEMLRRRAAGNQ